MQKNLKWNRIYRKKVALSLELAFVDADEELKAYEYSVLITNLDCEEISVVQHYIPVIIEKA